MQKFTKNIIRDYIQLNGKREGNLYNNKLYGIIISKRGNRYEF